MAPPILVAHFERRSELTPIVRAALDVEIVYVPLAAAPGHGRHTLQLWVGTEIVVSVAAELVGSGRSGEYPLRVRPLEDAQVAELEALVERRSGSFGPRPRRTSVRQEEPAAAPSGGMLADPDVRPRRSSVRREEEAAPAATLSVDRLESAPPPSNEPHPTLASRTEAAIEDTTLASRGASTSTGSSPGFGEEEPVTAQTTLFDPEHILRAPQAPMTGSEDSLTLPRPASSPPHDRRRHDPSTPVSDDGGTLPRDGGGVVAGAVSWNVRIAPTTKDPLCGRVIANGKYVLDSVIGTGAIGIVFKASHRDLGRTVAIKVLNPRYRDDVELLQTFRTEARAASQLEHPNVARVYDYGMEEDGLVYIVMEYLSGYTLGSVVASRRRLTEARALDVMVQVCAALSSAHDRGIVHRDIKPDNIILVPAQDDEGKPVEIVKVCDFGIAALGHGPAEGYAAGSPEYMAPEQATGSNVTASADVYACGIVLYEMLTGAVPFTDLQPYRILFKHQNEAPRPLSELVPGIAPSLEAAVLRALEKQPLRRFQNARELRIELRRIADSKA